MSDDDFPIWDAKNEPLKAPNGNSPRMLSVSNPMIPVRMGVTMAQ